MTLKFYTINDTDGTARLLKGWGFTQVDNPIDADLIVFNGGADIGTSIYGELSVGFGVPVMKSARDEQEIDLYNLCLQEKKFCMGICRGSQLLNCLNGGTLWQHVNNHGRGPHSMVDLRTGQTIEVTSTHHQMMRPNLKGGGVLIGVSSESTVKYSEPTGQVVFHPTDEPTDMEDVEIVWYPKTRTLCIQGHPEYVPDSQFARYTKDLLAECMSEVETSACVA